MNICNYPDDCVTCEVNGAIQQGNTHFEYDLNGLRMSCKCNCDSSYICIAEWINYISEATAISGSGIGSGAGSCQTCFMNNHYYRGNSNYTIVKAGVELNCECFCNEGIIVMEKSSMRINAVGDALYLEQDTKVTHNFL